MSLPHFFPSKYMKVDRSIFTSMEEKQSILTNWKNGWIAFHCFWFFFVLSFFISKMKEAAIQRRRVAMKKQA